MPDSLAQSDQPGSHSGERARRWARRIERQTEVRQDLLDHPAVLDRRHQTQAATTVQAGENIDRKGASLILHLPQ